LNRSPGYVRIVAETSGSDAAVLVINAGSSSIKVSCLAADDELLGCWDSMPEVLPRAPVVAHRVVHGGQEFSAATVVDDDVARRLADLVPLAPLHQPKSLDALRQVRALLPDAVHVACFDTAFHATIEPAAATYAIPREWSQRYGIRRYGFHGLSHGWVARTLADVAPERRRIVSCHLGAGASLAAILDGRSVDTTMGFTPLEGLVMATRSGDVDPGLVLWLAEREPDLGDVLERGSGLLGLAGTADMRELLARSDDDSVALALGVYLHRLRRAIAAMTASLGGIDACVFTGGVGENAVAVRAGATAGLDYLGIRVDPAANDAVVGDAEITAAGAAVRTFVITAREDREMARQARAVVALAGS
jgi:acetate kinase